VKGVIINLVVRFKSMPFFDPFKYISVHILRIFRRNLRGIATYRADVDHSFTEFDKCSTKYNDKFWDDRQTAKRLSPFDWNIHISNVVKNKVDQDFVSIFAEMLDKGL
jgi:hypothetical protein